MKPFQRPGEAHLQKLLNMHPFFGAVAKVEEKVIAGLTFYVLDHYYSERPLAYIYDLVVLEESQRKGVDRKLIDFTNKYCRQNGFEEVFVQAEKADDQTIEFYRSTKPINETPVVYFSYTLPNSPN